MIKTIHIIGLLALLLLTPTQVQSFQPFPDTGQTMCYDASHNEVSCDTIAPGDPYYGQDAHYQPRLPRSYTKLGHGGTVLPDNALHVDDGGPWMMTRDNVTGLIWEIKTKDNKNEQYNWQGAQEAFVAGLNNAVFAGFDDWRMPSREELASLLHRGTHNPTIDTCFFPNTVLSYYWSATTYAYATVGRSSAWSADFRNGQVLRSYKFGPQNVRAVRSGHSLISNFVDNKDGTVIDTATGLMWQKCPYGQTWDEAQDACTGSATNLNWQQALKAAENLKLAGYDDWRLPNINELQTLVDETVYSPALDTNFFPNKSSGYWSSTTRDCGTQGAWRVDFAYGGLHYPFKPYSTFLSVRAVRGGYSDIGSFDPLRLVFSDISDQTINEPFEVEISIRRGNFIATDINGPLNISASVGRVQTSEPVVLKNGTWTGSATMLNCSESVHLSASGQGTAGNSPSFVVAGCEIQHLGSLKGQVYLKGQILLPDVAIDVHRVVGDGYESTPVKSAYTNEYGMFLMLGLNPGQYLIKASNSGLNGSAYAIVQPNQINSSVSIHLREAKKKPLLVVHGIMGSTTEEQPQRLRDKSIFPKMPKKKPASMQDLHFLDPTILMGTERPVKLTEFMNDYEDDYAVYKVVWDWRVDLNEAWEKYLKPIIDQAKRETGNESVDIVAHSMGGLLVRAYMQDDSYDHDIDKFVMLGTPNQGSSNTYMIEEGGNPQLVDKIAPGLATFYHNTLIIEMIRQGYDLPIDEIKIRNFINDEIPTVNQLAPTYPFLSNVYDILIEAKCSQNKFLKTLNNNLSSKKDTFENTKTRLFLSNKKDTIYSINVIDTSGYGCFRSLYPSGKIFKRPFYDIRNKAFIDQWKKGDGTVLADEAAEPFREMGDDIVVTGNFGDHSGMFGNENIKQQVYEFLTGKELTSKVMERSTMLLSEKELSEDQSMLKMSIMGDVQPLISDESGRAAGVDPSTLSMVDELGQIQFSTYSGGSYLIVEDIEAAIYTVHLHGWENAAFRIELEYIAGDVHVSEVVTGFHVDGISEFQIDLSQAGENDIIIPPLEAPASVNSYEQEGNTIVSWNMVTDPRVIGYRVYAKNPAWPDFRFIGFAVGDMFNSGHAWNDSGQEVDWRYMVVSESSNDILSFYQGVAFNRTPSFLIMDSDGQSIGGDFQHVIPGEAFLFQVIGGSGDFEILAYVDDELLPPDTITQLGNGEYSLITSEKGIAEIYIRDTLTNQNSFFMVSIFQEEDDPDPADPIILTHTGPGTSFTGQWTLVTAPDAFQDESMVTQENGASFTFDTGHTGCRTVSLWWSQVPERHDAVPVEIYDDITLLDTVYVNQQAGGGQWQELGTYFFDHGAVIVVISDTSTHTTCVDALQTTAADVCQTVSQVLVPGWNLLTPVHQAAVPMTASLWAADMDSQGAQITRVQKWDCTGWQSYSPGAPFGDFAIDPGRGYFVFNQAQNPTSWESTGMPIPCPMTYEFTAGWNLMGFPLGLHPTASELAEAINTQQDHVTRIQKWDGSGWQSYSPGAPFGSFDITPGQGYFLFSSQPQASYTQNCNGDGPVCGAYVAPDVWKEFDCYNLAAIGKTTGADPFTPSWELIGGYWQWGRKGPDPGQWYDTNTPNFAHGPTGPGSSEANSEAISGWDSSDAPNGAWSDSSKTANDPCPAGYRVPTKAQWEGVDDNNTQSTVGTWSSSPGNPTNYSAALFFGDKLMLPAAGDRLSASGPLYDRGSIGAYWGSSENSGGGAWRLYFYSGGGGTSYGNRRDGRSVRCVAE
jgi:hypothetical protein